MDRFIYFDKLNNNIFQSANTMGLNESIFQKDNDPKRTSKIVDNYNEKYDITKIYHFIQSPDLNHIEHLCIYIKQNLRGINFTNKTDLINKIIEGQINV